MQKPKRSKYNARKTVVDGVRFDSAKEARRWSELKLLEKAGKIHMLTLQMPFPLFAKTPSGAMVPVGTYRCDFDYIDAVTGQRVTEDVKGMKTAIYRLKKKIVEAQYGIAITEV